MLVQLVSKFNWKFDMSVFMSYKNERARHVPERFDRFSVHFGCARLPLHSEESVDNRHNRPVCALLPSESSLLASS